MRCMCGECTQCACRAYAVAVAARAAGCRLQAAGLAAVESLLLPLTTEYLLLATGYLPLPTHHFLRTPTTVYALLTRSSPVSFSPG